MDLNAFLKLLGNLVPDQIIKIDDGAIRIGTQEYKVQDGIINLGEINVKIEYSPTIKFYLEDGTEITRLTKNQGSNQADLRREKVFTRADIAELQIQYLSIEQEHELVIKSLKPYLEDVRSNFDIGALLIASTIIRIEDKVDKIDKKLTKKEHEVNKNLFEQYWAKLHNFGRRGHMVYNLFRSKILEKEIIPYLKKVIENYSNFADGKRQFLIYWDEITEKGYPTAYFVKQNDKKNDFYSELCWRFEMGESKITIYSRNLERNQRVMTWLTELKNLKKINFKTSPLYNLGYSKAKKFEIERIF